MALRPSGRMRYRKSLVFRARRASLNWQGSGLEIYRDTTARIGGNAIDFAPFSFCVPSSTLPARSWVYLEGSSTKLSVEGTVAGK
jgi:hypothetical protein